MLSKKCYGITATITLLLATPVGAHTGVDHSWGVTSGFLHPLLGWDHLIAMLAVGLWAATREERSGQLLLTVFPLSMVIGAILAFVAVPIPSVETGIALSCLVLGLIVALSLKLPTSAAVLITGGFALFHGYAHGAEMPSESSLLTYGAGFLLATILLHMTGFLTMRKAISSGYSGIVRIAGAIASGFGLLALVGI